MKVFLFNLKRVLVPLVLITAIASTACAPSSSPIATPTMTPNPTKGGIEGRVYRSDTGESIANASVTLNDATKEDEDAERSVAENTTDQEGRYSLVNIEPGSYA